MSVSGVFRRDATAHDDATRALLAALASLRPAVTPLIVVPAAGRCGEGDAVVVEDVEGLVRKRYDGLPGSAYLLRPDQHVAARWREPDAAKIREAVARATCQA